MANRTVGIDSSVPVTDALVTTATQRLETAPLFWGRYFTSPKEPGTVEYRHAVENRVLAPKNIRVLPIARQTPNVGGASAQGSDDAGKNGADLLDTFGEEYLVAQGGKFLVFLDVEATGRGEPSLSADYYAGWTQGLANASQVVQFRPCVYARPDDAATWDSLQRAMTDGAPCYGLWLARYLKVVKEPVAWDAASLSPSPDPGVTALLWQYDGADEFDRNLVNPAIDPSADFLQYLILPPGA
jgi:hypothetical protein